MTTKDESATDPEIFVARLHRDKIETYERIHDSMTQQHADSVRRRFSLLDIYRLDDVLVMIKHPLPGQAPEESAAVEEEFERWREAVGECFAEFWRPANMIFELASAGR